MKGIGWAVSAAYGSGVANRFPKNGGCTNEFGKSNEEEARYAAINAIVHVIDN